MTTPGSAPSARKPGWLNVAFGILTLLFPLIALLLVRPLGPLAVTLGLVAVIALRSIIGFGRNAPVMMNLAALAAAVALGVIGLIDASLAMRLYPVLMNAAMFAVFAYSLIKPPSMIERFARIMEPNLPESGVRHTRNVTRVWCGFFLLNGAAALWTALFASLETWALYNGVIAYVLMGALFGVEFLVRGVVKAREADGRAAR